jgi:hypothetical protein
MEVLRQGMSGRAIQTTTVAVLKCPRCGTESRGLRGGFAEWSRLPVYLTCAICRARTKSVLWKAREKEVVVREVGGGHIQSAHVAAGELPT